MIGVILLVLSSITTVVNATQLETFIYNTFETKSYSLKPSNNLFLKRKGATPKLVDINSMRYVLFIYPEAKRSYFNNWYIKKLVYFSKKKLIPPIINYNNNFGFLIFSNYNPIQLDSLLLNLNLKSILNKIDMIRKIPIEYYGYNQFGELQYNSLLDFFNMYKDVWPKEINSLIYKFEKIKKKKNIKFEFAHRSLAFNNLFFDSISKQVYIRNLDLMELKPKYYDFAHLFILYPIKEEQITKHLANSPDYIKKDFKLAQIDALIDFIALYTSEMAKYMPLLGTSPLALINKLKSILKNLGDRRWGEYKESFSFLKFTDLLQRKNKLHHVLIIFSLLINEFKYLYQQFNDLYQEE